MTLEHLSFGVSDKTRNNLKKQLTLDAAKKFQEQATIFTQAFDAKDYKVINVQMGDNNNYSYTMPVAMPVAQSKSIGIEHLNLKSAKTTLSYSASGTIELIR